MYMAQICVGGNTLVCPLIAIDHLRGYDSFHSDWYGNLLLIVLYTLYMHYYK